MADIYIMGFTGTRNGMTYEQRAAAELFIQSMKEESARDGMDVLGHHGDCVGADADFHQICRDEGLEVNQRPCTFPNLRAHTDAHQISEPVAPMARNQMIVDDCDVLLACPPSMEELKRGGTWATIRMGRRSNKQVIIIYPDGSIVEDCPGEHPDARAFN